MMNKIYTVGEIATIETNLNALEDSLGHSLPGGIIDVSELRDHILTPGEVLTYTQNIRMIEKNHMYKNHNNDYRRSNSSTSNIEYLLGFIFLVVGALLVKFGVF